MIQLSSTCPACSKIFLISLVVTEAFFEELSKEDQQILIEAQKIAKAYAREQSDQRIDERIQIIKDSGTEIITLNEETMEEMKTASQPVYEEIAEVVDSEILKLYSR